MDGGEGRINSATSILGTFNLNRDCGEIQLLLLRYCSTAVAKC